MTIFQGTQTARGSDVVSGTTTSVVIEALPVTNLTALIRQATVVSKCSPFDNDPTYAAFFDALARALHRTEPKHTLLVRERGVGEQTVLGELARRGGSGELNSLRDKQILMVDCRHVEADEIRNVMQGLLNQAFARDDLILCLDGFASLLRGNGRGDPLPGLLSILQRSRCRIVGILSPHEYEERLASDAECRDVFSVVRLHEPEPSMAINWVAQVATGLQTHYTLTIEPAAIQRAVILSNSYILHERLPHKAVKVLRTICDDIEYERSQLNNLSRTRITEEDVIAKIAEMSGVPVQTLAGVGDSFDYFESLSSVIVGQEHAVREVAIELGLIKAGLVDDGKPASVLLFIGQTGTGKTEMAKALARMYSSSKRLRTFTLGNFSEPHSVSGIIGVPAGYVGHDQGGRLVNELNADPYGVFLLDEADKAHPDVMQPFLNLFDEGWLYDQRGVKAYADRAIFILTTNVGQRQIFDMFKNGKSVDEITHTMKESLAKIRHTKSNRPVFTPEFLARVKRIIVFRPLDKGALLGIANKLIADMIREWRAKRQKCLKIPEELIQWVAGAAHGVNERSQGKEGGRIVRKFIADYIEAPIQRAISKDADGYRRSENVVVNFSANEVTTESTSAVAADIYERVQVNFV